MNKSTLAIAAALVALYVLFSSIFFVDETEHVIITEFGQYKTTYSEPGVRFKVPWQTIRRLERRILASDAPPSEYLTSDKKRLLADPVTRWRIVDPLNFYKSVTSEVQAKSRLDDLVLSELRQELAQKTMGEMIGAARTEMMDNVTSRTRAKALEFGIEVVDVRIKHLDLPKEVRQSVFARMVAERERLAKGYRAQGQEESDKITSRTDKDVKILLATAKKEAEQRRGEGDAEGTKIYAGAYGKDPEFYAFIRNLEAYEKAVDQTATVVLSTDSQLFRYLTKPGKP
jgi:modulator of FtsH protease HflC